MMGDSHLSAERPSCGIPQHDHTPGTLAHAGPGEADIPLGVCVSRDPIGKVTE
jgi:hypothetical protein